LDKPVAKKEAAVMKEVGAFEAKTHLSQYLQEVENGEEIIIKRRDRAIAVLRPFADQQREKRTDKAERILAALREVREEESTPCAAGEIADMIAEGRKW
jgi:antitoxin (DNA-binding transcriptional repressor) of toxin-antitoxin stability system